MNPNASPRAAAVLRALLDGPGGAYELAGRVGRNKENVRDTLRKLLTNGHVEQGPRVGKVRSYRLTAEGERRARQVSAEPPPPPKSETRIKLAVVSHYVHVAGDRRDDCAHADDCTTAHALRYSGPASCPRGCRWYVAAEPLRATDYASSGRGHYEAAVYAGAAS